MSLRAPSSAATTGPAGPRSSTGPVTVAPSSNRSASGDAAASRRRAQVPQPTRPGIVSGPTSTILGPRTISRAGTPAAQAHAEKARPRSPGSHTEIPMARSAVTDCPGGNSLGTNWAVSPGTASTTLRTQSAPWNPTTTADACRAVSGAVDGVWVGVGVGGGGGDGDGAQVGPRGAAWSVRVTRSRVAGTVSLAIASAPSTPANAACVPRQSRPGAYLIQLFWGLLGSAGGGQLVHGGAQLVFPLPVLDEVLVGLLHHVVVPPERVDPEGDDRHDHPGDVVVLLLGRP